MKHIIRNIAALLAITAAALAYADADNVMRETIPVWPEGKMPGADADKITDKNGKIPEIRELPRLEVFLPQTHRKTGFMIICPGGAYMGLASNHEGTQIANWISDEDIPCAILFYRVPNKPPAPPPSSTKKPTNQ